MFGNHRGKGREGGKKKTIRGVYVGDISRYSLGDYGLK